jgi:Spy/CpxP family protein refolding chaperone
LLFNPENLINPTHPGQGNFHSGRLTLFNPHPFKLHSSTPVFILFGFKKETIYTMKKILSTAFAIVLFVGVSQAQTTEDKGRHNKGHRQEQAFNQLNLTPDQKAKFESIRETQKKELQELKKSGNVTPEQRKAIHEKYKTQYQAVLTPAQQDQFSKQRKEWKENGKKGQKGQKSEKGQGFGKRGGDLGKQAAFFKQELNLSADQESKLKSIFQEFQTKSQAIRSNSSLSKEQQRAQFQSLAKQYMAQGKSVLTPEQLKKFNDLKGKRKNNRKADNV